jgi:amino acid adenylation domain-containing protein
MREINVPDNRRIAANQLAREREYWTNKFKGELTLSHFPYDHHKRDDIKSIFNTVGFKFSNDSFYPLEKLTKGSCPKLHVVLMTALAALIHIYTGHHDIIIGTPIDKQEIDAEFSNTVLALRNKLVDTMTFKELLLQVRQIIIEAIENQNYPIEALLNHLDMKFSDNGFPLFDTALLLENIHDRKYLFPAKPNIIFSFLRTSEYIEGAVEYNSLLYKKSTIEGITRHFLYLLQVVLSNLDIPLSGISLLTEQEQRRLLFDFNNTETAYPRDKTIHALFANQAGKIPDHPAVIEEATGRSITYRELNLRSHQLARELEGKGATDHIVGIMAHRSIDLIIGILGILKTGAAYLPLEPDLPPERILYMLEDSGADLLVTEKFLDKKVRFNKQVVYMDSLGDNGIDPINESLDKHSNDPGLAYISYTSGSTGRPKGVMIEHRGLVNYIWWAAKSYVKNEKVNFPLYTSIAFDLTVTSIFTPLITGQAIVVFAGDGKVPLIQSVIESDRVGVVKLTPSHLKLIRNRPGNNKGIKRLILGGEDFEAQLARDIYRSFAGGVEIYNEYGPTETVVGSMIYRFDTKEDRRPSVPIGVPADNTRIYILDKNRKPVPKGVVGELYISGAGVARGYLNRAELTVEKFLENPFIPGEKMYRTGDLAVRFLDDKIYYSGRIDQQVKIRGHRVELGEIEACLLKQEGVKAAVVMAGSHENGSQYLCAYVVSVKEIDFTQLKEYLSGLLPGYMVPDFIVSVQEIPLTLNGKVDKKALPDPLVNLEKQDLYEAPGNKIEETLVEIWWEILRTDKDKIGIHHNFFELGGNSLNATVLAARIHKELGVSISLGEIFKAPTIRDLASFIQSAGKTSFIDIKKVEEKEYYQLSYNQKRLWIIHQMAPQNPSYNMGGVISLNHRVNEEILKKTLSRLFTRHESLRTGFKEVDDQPIQFIEKSININLEIIDISSLEGKEKQERKGLIHYELEKKPFHLSRVPLFRSVLIKLDEESYNFVFSMHHIITDAWSMGILHKEFLLLYEGYRTGEEVRLEPLTLQYKDFCQWSSKQYNDPLVKEISHGFWREKLESGIPALELRRDFPGNSHDPEEAGYRCMVNNEVKDRLKKLALDYNTSLFSVMFSAYMIFLSRFSNQEDIVCSIIASGREHLSLHGIIGFFVNSVVFKTFVDKEKSFADFIREMHGDLLEIFKHQTYPLELVCNQLKISYPDVPVSFNMVNIPDQTRLVNMDYFEPYHINNANAVKFDLEPYIVEHKNGIEILWSYRKRMFEPDSIVFMVKEYIKILDFFSRKPHENYNAFKQTKKKKSRWKNESARASKQLAAAF